MEYKGKSKEWLEKYYSPSRWSKKHNEDDIITHHFEVSQRENANVFQEARCDLNVPYGSSERQKMNIFYADGHDVNPSLDIPVLLFIHGGYWQIKEITRATYNYVAAMFANFGVTCVSASYDTCPDVTLSEIVEQIENVVEHVRSRFPNSNLFVSGHSAGGHLTAMMVNEGRNVTNRISGIIPLSGVFDLTPLLSTPENEALKLTNQTVTKVSPLYLEAVTVGKVLVVVGDAESPEFIKQSEAYHQYVTSQGINSRLLILPGDEDHFSLMESLAIRDSQLLKEMLSFILNDSVAS